jgi:predicted dehydrogenase
MSRSKIAVGMVGLGIGQYHLRSLAAIPEAEIVAIADLLEDRLREQAARYGARPYPHWQAMLDAEPDLDAVILATPVPVRREPIRAICARGLALFCEKPPAGDLATALPIAGMIAQAGILNMVGFQYRWAPLAERLRSLVQGRALSFARIVVAWPVFDWVAAGTASAQLYSKAHCGGPLVEQGVHYQDVLRYITGDEPLVVQAMDELGQIEPLAGRDTAETTVLIARHASGMLSTHVHNWSHQGSLLQLQVVGRDVDLTWHMQQESRLVGAVEGRAIDERDGSDPRLLEMRGFVDAVLRADQSQVRSTYLDACRTLAVCQAATTAAETGRPIHVPRVEV